MTFEERCELARRLYAASEGERRAHFHPDVRVVTRDGELRGAPAVDYLLAFFPSDYKTSYEVERFFDAGDGKVVAFLKITHTSVEVGAVTTWPAAIFVMDDAGLVRFFEGYPDRDKALRDAGLA